MTRQLVERLKKRADMVTPWATCCGEAAAEIERLTTALHGRIEVATNLHMECERLRAAASGIDRYLLVIESAVRNADPSQHGAVLAALQANRAALEPKS
jgi:hypothetical protein